MKLDQVRLLLVERGQASLAEAVAKADAESATAVAELQGELEKAKADRDALDVELEQTEEQLKAALGDRDGLSATVNAQADVIAQLKAQIDALAHPSPTPTPSA